jgi:hypothetical protein
VALAGQALDTPAPRRRTYRLEPYSPERQRQQSDADVALLEKLNRCDRVHLARLTEVVVPEVGTDPELAYSPLPESWPWASAHAKALVVHQPMQVFGAYEGGRLVRWGPVSTGRAETPTPSGLFNLTWKAKSRRSTDNAEWILNWYFNFVNRRGVSFHEFELPGRPASHACVRLLQRDAQWVYAWGEQWRLSPDGRQIVTAGTPVVVLGTYDFRRPAPWRSLEAWTSPIDLPADPAAPTPGA